jgi:hypothetical protein
MVSLRAQGVSNSSDAAAVKDMRDGKSGANGKK